MKLRFGPIAFAIGFCCAYAIAYWNNLPLFLYYPLHGDFTWGTHVLNAAVAGPGMAWYGFMADATIVALILALLVPDRLFDRLLRNYLWVFPCASMATCVYLLRLFLLHS